MNAIGETIAPAPEPGSSGNETDYYGTLTASAVKALQCEKGIVCGGTPETTGFGLLGPKTRSLLNSLVSNFSSLFSDFLQTTNNQLQTNPRSQLAALEGAGSGLVARWTFDEGSGTIAGDSSGNNNIGTLTNGPTWTTDSKVGSAALQFDGVDDYVNAGNLGSLDLTTGDFSISLWVQSTITTNGDMLIYKENTSPS